LRNRLSKFRRRLEERNGKKKLDLTNSSSFFSFLVLSEKNPNDSYVNTAACRSKISYIDGDAGILRYRGYPIEQLASKTSFEEVRREEIF
jgi:Citrate synthase, C-terminal domain